MLVVVEFGRSEIWGFSFGQWCLTCGVYVDSMVSLLVPLFRSGVGNVQLLTHLMLDVCY